jgi:LysR family transcriptional activator of nhaA
VAVQTISAQIAQLEQSLGKALLAPQGRRLVPTEAGRLALAYADQIFQLGERMDAALREADASNTLRLAVGISDALPKLIAYRLMEAVFHLPQQVRLVCREGEFDTLLAELALHRLDVVLTDRPAPHGGNLKVFSHGLGEFDITLFGAPELARRYRKGFPGNLDGAPTAAADPRQRAARPDRALAGNPRSWRRCIVGEFEDSALLTTFGRAGLGLFPGAFGAGRGHRRATRRRAGRRAGRGAGTVLRDIERAAHPPPGSRGNTQGAGELEPASRVTAYW